MHHKKKESYRDLAEDMFYVFLSVIFALLIVRFGVIKNLISLVREGQIIGSFMAGIFFTSAFTIAPSSVALAEISHSAPVFIVAFWGACGAVVGDTVIFLFVRDRFAHDLSEALASFHDKKLTRFFHRRFFKWLGPLIGAFIIASPLPDEMGVTMMGISKIRTWILVLISFVMNFVGVLFVAYIAGTLRF